MITTYELPNGSTKIFFSEAVINHMRNNIQNDSEQSYEVGGQLFAQNICEAPVCICKITGPYPTDQRSRYGWVPDTDLMSKDRITCFNSGLYVVGLWHTHPESVPTSSLQDRQTAEKHLDLLEDCYNGFLLITMGYDHVSVEYLTRKDKVWHQLEEVVIQGSNILCQ